ncbi:uncharacterized protein [Anabrus simplex]|uniref:uncharacterized protein n=1 Tax=Anabrus simplex TaxID=316456 RepID=UPI0035A26F9E
MFLQFRRTMDRAAWISSELLPSLVAEGTLSSDGAATILSCKVTVPGETGDHFASSVYIVNLQLGSDDATHEINLIVKMEPDNDFHSKVMDIKVLFANEILMYSQALTKFREYIKSHHERFTFTISDLFPHCYKVTDCNGGSVLILENLKTKHFSLYEDIFLDYERCVAALQQLGRYHGLAYAYKKHNPGDFFSVIQKLAEPRYHNTTPQINQSMTATALRGIKYVKSQDVEECMLNFLQKIEQQVRDPVVLMQELVRPTEPLAVLCHGDFCRNNIFFRSSGDDAKPCEMKMFDLQLARYSSPAIDTAFFAYMSMSAELRKEHWNSLFQCYHTMVVNTLSQALNVTIENLGPEFSLQSFKEDFAKHAIYGYMLCSFFLPIMMSPKDELPDYQLMESQPELAEQIITQLGGEPATKLLGEIVKEICEINTS